MDAVAACIFVAGGVATLTLYAFIVWCPPARALSRSATWGCVGRHGKAFALTWAGGAVVTAAAMVGFMWWLLHNNPDGWALAGLGVFMAGATLWPYAVLTGSLRGAQAGVVVTAVGAGALLGWAVLNDAPALVLAAAGYVAFWHGVVDMAWAITSKPAYTVNLL